MTEVARSSPMLVLASRRAFEAFAGPIPSDLEAAFRFAKPRASARIKAWLPASRLLITKNYPRPDLNRWVFEARRRGIPTLLMVDGPLEWSNVFRNASLRQAGAERARGLYDPVIHDAVAGIGPAQCDWIEERNAGRGLWLMSYANARIDGPRAATTDRDRSPPAEEHRPFDFLLTSARTASFDEREQAALADVLKRCARALEATSQRVLVRLFDEDLRAVVRAAAPSARFDESGDFASALRQVRCVIGTPSSVLLEAMAAGHPTASLMFRDSPLFYQPGWLLGCSDDWTASFASMLACEPERMAQQRSTLESELSPEDFFEHCRRIAGGAPPTHPRPLDRADLEFENRVLHSLLGWRARLAAPLLRIIGR